MLMNIGLGPRACEEREIQTETEREIKRTEGGRMEEDNGFAPNKCTAWGTCGEEEKKNRDKKRLEVRHWEGKGRGAAQE